MALNTQLPPWLSESYNPQPQSPWILQALQQGMQREEMRRKLPLQLQGMALENQERAIALRKQSILNDQANQNMLDYHEQLPRFQEWLASAKGDPVAIARSFPQGITNPQLLKEVGDYQLAASRSLVVETAKQNMIEDAKLVFEASKAGGRFRLGQDGLLSDEDRAAAGAVIRARELQNFTAKAEAEGAARLRYEKDAALTMGSDLADLQSQLRESQRKTLEPDESNPEYRAELDKQMRLQTAIGVMEAKIGGASGIAAKPTLIEQDGVKFFMNPKTGNLHKISQTVDKKTFIANHVSSWMRDMMIDSKEAARQLSEFYDQNLAPSTASSSNTPTATKHPLKPGAIIEQSGRRYRYQGGDENDASSFVEIK